MEIEIIMLLILNIGVSGGSLHYARNIINNLDSEKHVVSSKNSIVSSPSSNEMWNTYDFGIKSIFCSFTYLPFYLIKTAFNILRNKYDCLYLPYIHNWSPFFICIFKLLNKKIYLTIHDGPLVKKNKIKSDILLKFCVKNSTHLIFLTKYVKEKTIANYKISSNIKTTIQPHGLIYPNGITSTPRTWKPKMNILFFGKVLESKGIIELIKAVEEIHQKIDKLHIVGKWYYNLKIIKQEYFNIVDKYIHEEDIAKYFNKCDILVLPYREASQSGVLTIGIAASMPMIVSNHQGLKEQLSENEAIFVNGDSESIKKALTRLIYEPIVYENLSRELYVKQNKLNWIDISNNIKNFIQN
jgi:glycosyltransferase involved in cell wall biosynthesis